MKKYDIDEKIFEQIFGHTLIELADKLINTTNKEENQIIVKNINKNKDKIYEQKRGDWAIQPSNRYINLIDPIILFQTLMKNLIRSDWKM